jgi:hypothetical protein
MIGGKTQTVSEGAIAVQTNGDVVINQSPSITTQELRNLVNTEFHAEFFKLLGMAGDIATARAEAVIEKFIIRIEKDEPEVIQQASDPDFRHAIYMTQKTAARAGDDELEGLLVELLLQRGKQANRNLLQIVLNESLEAVGLLTDEQISTLTLIFLIRYTSTPEVINFYSFVKLADQLFQPYVTNAAYSRGTFSHLSHAGCGSVSLTSIKLAQVLFKVYPGLWQQGVAPDDPSIINLQPYASSRLVPCEHSPHLLRVNVASQNQLSAVCKQLHISTNDENILTNLLSRPPQSDDQIKINCVKAAPYFANLFEIWDSSEMQNFLISNIGMAIGHANVSRTNKFEPLNVWIN